ncbi:peptide chain release factor 2 [Patescibacteria group bacterium]|nr:peptide chain release factor 2 [Patescibacteria group bacterium]
MENLIKNIEILREQVIKTHTALDIEGKKSELRDLKRLISVPDFWNNREKAVEVSRKAEDLEKVTGKWDKLRQDIRSLEEFVAYASKEGDDSVYDESNAMYEEYKQLYDELEFGVLFSGKYDESNAVISVHAGSGGVDAQDFAQILERMYLRYCEKKKFKVMMVDRVDGGEAGIKSSSFEVRGSFAYGNLKGEAGIHRLVRISPFDAESMRHTSFASVDVIPVIEETQDIIINESDLRIDTYKSGGPGGQSVNTTDSAIRIVHIPTNTTVTCQTERSQHQNKETAFKILKSKLYKLEQDKREAEEAKLRGEVEKADWGKQIRSYVMQPYKMVKDHRTNFETQDIDGVLEGEIEGFIVAYLKGEITSEKIMQT